jgi:hypothetical protein
MELGKGDLPSIGWVRQQHLTAATANAAGDEQRKRSSHEE